MIENKADLKRFLEQDKKMLMIPSNQKFPRPFYDEVWKFQIALRKAEYAVNCKKGLINLPYRLWRKLMFHRISVKLGFSIPLNVIDEGLSIAHYGVLVINSNAKIGKNCRIQEGVTIGSSGSSAAPVIGNNVFIGTGAKIIGDITIADNVAIGAGAVVVKNISAKNVTVAGIPAKIISQSGSGEVFKLLGND